MYFDETAWVAIAFILFIALVWKKGSKAITSTLDDRSLLIQKELDEAKLLKEEALEELRKSIQIQQNSSDEFEKIIYHRLIPIILLVSQKTEERNISVVNIDLNPLVTDFIKIILIEKDKDYKLINQSDLEKPLEISELIKIF